MNFNNTILNDFIDYIIKYDDVDSILNNCKTQSDKGQIYESLWNIIIKLGFCDKFPNASYLHKIGNSNNGKLQDLVNLNYYMSNEKIYNGNASGCSDITLQNKNNGTYTFISCKYPKSPQDIAKQKNIKYYDVQNILAMCVDNSNIYKNYEIYLLVPDKSNILNKVKNANKSSTYITKHMKDENIMDKNDLNKYFLEFKNDIIKNKKLCNQLNYNELYTSNKENLKLRFHQELITQKTVNLININNDKSFLWGCKCRSGKTYMAGGIITKLHDIKQHNFNVLIITPVPTETMPQFTDDLFDKFKNFDNFKIHQLNANSLKNMVLDNNNIFVTSKQFLQKYTDKNAITKLQNLDLIIFDENHFSGTTDLSKDILNSYTQKDTVKIYLTATFAKPLNEWNISEDCQMYWDIEDEQICKSIIKNQNNIIKLKIKHGDIVDDIIKQFIDKGQTLNDIFTPYTNMPDMHLITNMFDKQRYDNIKEKIMDSKYGFSFDVLFSLKDNKNEFNYVDEIKIFLRYVTGSQKEIDFKDGDKSIFARINKLCSRNPFTQIWFLPSDNINKISQCLKLLMRDDNILKHYDILCINRNNDELAKNIKDEITKQEIIAKDTGKRGLILLAGNMLSLGITINSCDVVFLMNNSLSSDKIMQQMYRCMTEGNNKNMGFVIDLNIGRVVNTCINYTTLKHNLNVEDKIKYIIENNLISIDADMLINKQTDIGNIINKLMDIWKGDPINNFKTLLKSLDNEYVLFDNPTQKLINQYFMGSTKKNKMLGSVEIKDDTDELQVLPDGKIATKSDDNNDSDIIDSDKDTMEKENKIIMISFTKDVLPHIIPLISILTIKNNNMNFMAMLNDIKNNKELLSIFDDQCIIWFNNDNLIDFIKIIVEKHFNQICNTSSVLLHFKMSLQSLLDDPVKLLNLINSCLRPKDEEKKKFGEVFTPMEFINNSMLKDLENHYLTTNKKNIWENKNLTFYDPAAGMGNFPIAIYYKLLDGLKKMIPNEKERKKHIIEKQLYMGELNKKNCFVIKQIFNINNEYKLNLYEGDTLSIKINEIFKINKFDVIIGNPPYNEELKIKKGSATALYHKFIEYYIDKCDMLTFVIPSRWFCGGKGLDKFRIMMLNRKDIVYIKHYDDASKIFGNSVEIKGGVNHFLVDKKYTGLCNFNGSLLELNKYDVMVDSKYYSIINKIMQHKTIATIFIGQSYSGINSNDKRLLDNKTDTTYACYVSQQKGFLKYIEKDSITSNRNFNKWKVITTRSSFGANSSFGNMFIGKPNELCNQSYILFEISNEIQAKSLLSYMKCKLPNFMLSLRKTSQDISESTCKWIPLPPLNKMWNDNDVYEYFKLTDDEITMIKQTKIPGYKEIQ